MEVHKEMLINWRITTEEKKKKYANHPAEEERCHLNHMYDTAIRKKCQRGNVTAPIIRAFSQGSKLQSESSSVAEEIPNRETLAHSSYGLGADKNGAEHFEGE